MSDKLILHDLISNKAEVREWAWELFYQQFDIYPGFVSDNRSELLELFNSAKDPSKIVLPSSLRTSDFLLSLVPWEHEDWLIGNLSGIERHAECYCLLQKWFEQLKKEIEQSLVPYNSARIIVVLLFRDNQWVFVFFQIRFSNDKSPPQIELGLNNRIESQGDRLRIYEGWKTTKRTLDLLRSMTQGEPIEFQGLRVPIPIHRLAIRRDGLMDIKRITDQESGFLALRVSLGLTRLQGFPASWGNVLNFGGLRVVNPEEIIINAMDAVSLLTGLQRDCRTDILGEIVLPQFQGRIKTARYQENKIIIDVDVNEELNLEDYEILFIPEDDAPESRLKKSPIKNGRNILQLNSLCPGEIFLRHKLVEIARMRINPFLKVEKQGITKREKRFGYQKNLLIGQILNGRYKIIEELGKGGSGTVYVAVLENDTDYASKGTKIAIKIYKSEILDTPNQMRRIQREGLEVFAREAVKECHYLCKIYALEYLDSIPYLVMEHVEGRCLLEDIRERDGRSYDPKVILKWTTQICVALETLHGENFVHRDIKPENIIINNQREAILLDFGIIKDLSEDTFTEKNQLMGSWYYAPPEILTNGKIFPQTDLYLLGSTLFHIITLKKPHVNLTKPMVLQADQLRLKPFEECDDKFLMVLVNRLVSHDIQKRPPSTSAIIRAIHAYEEFRNAPDQLSQRKFEEGLHQLQFIESETSYIIRKETFSSEDLSLPRGNQELNESLQERIREMKGWDLTGVARIIGIVQKTAGKRDIFTLREPQRELILTKYGSSCLGGGWSHVNDADGYFHINPKARIGFARNGDILLGRTFVYYPEEDNEQIPSGDLKECLLNFLRTVYHLYQMGNYFWGLRIHISFHEIKGRTLGLSRDEKYYHNNASKECGKEDITLQIKTKIQELEGEEKVQQVLLKIIERIVGYFGLSPHTADRIVGTP